jgi:hypothetical protein
MGLAPLPESTEPFTVEEPLDAVPGDEPGLAGEPCEATGVAPRSPRVFTASAGRVPGSSGPAGAVADPTPALVVTTGFTDGVVTETVATGVVTATVTVGTVVGTSGTEVGTVVGTAVDWVIGAVVDTGADTVGTTVGTVGTAVGIVTVSPSGRAVASTFATKKPETPKQISTTIVLHFTILISPSARLA